MRGPAPRLVAGIVVVLAVLGTTCAAVVAGAAGRYYDELTQQLNANIAMYVERAAPLLRDGQVDTAQLALIAGHAMVVNPLAQVYVLDARGVVVGGGAGKVDLAPVRRWLAGGRGPVYGDDPARPGSRSVFSASPVAGAAGGAGYVYVVLGGDRSRGLAASLASSHILVVTLLLVTSIMVTASLVAILIDRRARRTHAQIELLREIDKERRRLFESIGHDLRTPLAAMCGYLDVLECDSPPLPDDQRRAYLLVVSQHCHRLMRLVSQIFRLARLESPGMVPMREPVAVHELARDVGARFERDATRDGRRVILQIDRCAPRVLADCELLETVIENLLDNAIRHGGCADAATLAVTAGKDAVTVSVRDRGEGLPQVCLDATSAQGTGRRGLGLVIVRRALELLGSRLEVHTNPQGGTTMSFRLAVMKP
jgi:signal transduction histidine kinase